MSEILAQSVLLASVASLLGMKKMPTVLGVLPTLLFTPFVTESETLGLHN